MTAGPFLLDEVVARAFPKWRKSLGRRFPTSRRRRIEVTLIFIGLLYASFSAFNEEHEARKSAESALRTAIAQPVPIPITETDQEARRRLSDQQKLIQELQSKLKEDDEIIESMKPVKRSLTRDQRQSLVKALKDGVNHTISIRRDPQTPETQDYSDQWESVFKEAGWSIVAPKFLIHNRAERGLRIIVRDLRYPPPDANLLYQAMLDAAITVTGGEAPPFEADEVELLIGFPDDVTQPSPTPSTEASPP
jgi:hypothetical protein